MTGRLAALRIAEHTDGAVDPTVGRAMGALGYDRDITAIAQDGPAVTASAPSRSWRGVRLERWAGLLTVPAGTALDRTLLRRTPHLVLDGALAAATAVVAAEVVVAVHDTIAYDIVRAAVRERDDTRRVRVERAEGRCIAGEARTLLRVLDGGPALPPGRRNLSTERGGLVSNVEAFAQIALLIRLGARRFAETGTRDEPGTTLLTVGGAVGRGGVVEIPLGTPLGIVLSAAHAGAASYVVAGGYHGTWLRPDPDVAISRSGLAAIGATLGAGVLYVRTGLAALHDELLAHRSGGGCRRPVLGQLPIGSQS